MTESTGILAPAMAAARNVDGFSVVVLEELLAPPVLDRVRQVALASPGRFVPTRVLLLPGGEPGVDVSQRRSLVLHDPDPWVVELFRNELLRVLPDVLARMGRPSVRPSAIDVQMAVTEDGGHFRGHVDSTDSVLSDRRLAFVYFFYREPKSFSGGRLRIVERLAGDGRDRTAARVDVVPAQNRMVCFPPRFVHEVHEVSVPSGRFEDGRFTVNGWVRW
ncbi:MAG TPA: 2OG-Fe(II) oxygenase [Acidimicrobiales bacterium]|nr:2OG-Fe(II) oxygenase [Acidimicrobiales bacterium]